MKTKLLFCCVLCCIALPSHIIAAPGSGGGPIAVIATDVLSLREEPSLSSARIGRMLSGERVLILDRTGLAEVITDPDDGTMVAPWYNVKTGSGAAGWCYGAYLDVPAAMELTGSFRGELHGEETIFSFLAERDGLRLRVHRPKAEGKVPTMISATLIPWNTEFPLEIRLPDKHTTLSLFPDADKTVCFESLFVFNGDGTEESGFLERLSFRSDPPLSLEPAGRTASYRNGYKPVLVTPLHLAAFDGDTETMRRLLEAGTDPDAAAAGDPVTPLYNAIDFYAKSGSTEPMRILLDAGADADRLLFDGMTPLFHLFHLFFRRGDAPLEAAALLLDRGAKSNRSTDLSIDPSGVLSGDYYETFEPFSVAVAGALQKGAEASWIELLRLMLEKGASPRCGMGGLYPDVFFALVKEDRPDLMELMLAYGIDNVKTNTRQQYSNSSPAFNVELLLKDLERALKHGEASEKMQGLTARYLDSQ